MVFGSLFNEGLFLFIEDIELQLLVDDLGFKVGLGGREGSDFIGGFGDFIGCEVDSSVVTIDGGFTVSFISSVLHVGILLGEDEVLS